MQLFLEPDVLSWSKDKQQHFLEAWLKGNAPLKSGLQSHGLFWGEERNKN